MSIQRIALRRAGRVRERVELVLVLGEILRERLEQRRALMEREPPQRGPADVARVIEHARENRCLERTPAR